MGRDRCGYVADVMLVPNLEIPQVEPHSPVLSPLDSSYKYPGSYSSVVAGFSKYILDALIYEIQSLYYRYDH
jgi:hypothetical protein